MDPYILVGVRSRSDWRPRASSYDIIPRLLPKRYGVESITCLWLTKSKTTLYSVRNVTLRVRKWRQTTGYLNEEPRWEQSWVIFPGGSLFGRVSASAARTPRPGAHSAGRVLLLVETPQSTAPRTHTNGIRTRVYIHLYIHNMIILVKQKRTTVVCPTRTFSWQDWWKLQEKFVTLPISRRTSLWYFECLFRLFKILEA